MSDMTTPPDPTPAPVTEPLQLPDQAPVAPAQPQPAAKTSHTRTILEVVGVVVAFFLILGAGTVGFVVGHATSNGGVKHGRVAVFQQGDGGMMGGLGSGQGKGRGNDQQGQQGFGGPGMMGDPRGVDPDGDNWTGGGQQGQGTDPNAPQSPVTPQTPASPQASPSGA